MFLFPFRPKKSVLSGVPPNRWNAIANHFESDLVSPDFTVSHVRTNDGVSELICKFKETLAMIVSFNVSFDAGFCFLRYSLRINPRQKVPRPIQRRYQRRCQLHPLRLYHPLSVVQRVLTGRPETFQHSIASAISR